MSYNFTGLPLDLTDQTTKMQVETAMLWIKANTTLTIDPEAELPANVQLFVVKFCELYGQTYGVASESLGGMSQSFSTSSGNGAALLSDLAASLFGDDYKGRNRFVAAVNRWR